MRDSIRIRKTKGGGIRVTATGKSAEALFRLMKGQAEEKPPKPSAPTSTTKGDSPDER